MKLEVQKRPPDKQVNLSMVNVFTKKWNFQVMSTYIEDDLLLGNSY